MTEPLVSVNMITYNHAPFIVQAIEGVLQQRTNFPFDLVIGEDCSIDGTREIVFEYQEKCPDIIRVVTSDKNVGAKINGFRTLKACQGKYIAFCEGDDYWHNPDKLQKQADYLESHPECGMVYSSYDVYHVKTKKKIMDFANYRKMKMPVNPSISDVVEVKGVPLTCTVMARRILCEQIIESDPYLHQSDHFLMGDTQLWAEMATKARLDYIPESLATHNITEESATRSHDKEKVLRFAISGEELILYLCDKYKLPLRIRNRHETHWYGHLLDLAFYTRNRELADEVRNKKKIFTPKEWLRYYGARSRVVHDLYRVSALLRNVFRKKHSQWR
jgi:glycosyltransferase involved in cell wall biosynthesis